MLVLVVEFVVAGGAGMDVVVSCAAASAGAGAGEDDCSVPMSVAGPLMAGAVAIVVGNWTGNWTGKRTGKRTEWFVTLGGDGSDIVVDVRLFDGGRKLAAALRAVAGSAAASDADAAEIM